MARKRRSSPFHRHPARSRPKQAPPAAGLRATGSADTWWGRRWIEALNELGWDVGGRLERGRTYARAGRVHELALRGTKVKAKVLGTRTYRVAVALEPLGKSEWARVVEALAARAEFAASLLAGEMPRQVEDAFLEAGTGLFPSAEELATECSCPDFAVPCKHVAALHYVLAQTIDRDPFLLFELRGMGRDALLAALRGSKKAGGPRKAIASGRAAEGERSSAEGAPPAAPLAADARCDLPALDAAAYDSWRGSAPQLTILPGPAVRPGALLRQLGSPPSWFRHEPASAHLILLARAAAAHALEQLADPDPG